jgi:hypothetical protein
MCSYMAMFPPTLPHYFVTWLTDVGDVVYDPFSGRGTTVLEACLLGRIGLGSDASPLAWVLSSAKAQPPGARVLSRRIEELRSGYRRPGTASVEDHIRLLFSQKTLEQLVWLQRELQMTRQVDRYLMAALLGVLHANARSDGTPRGLSVAMPNTFSMAPGYVSRYVRKHRLVPPEVDVFDVIERRLTALGSIDEAFSSGRAWQQDAQKLIRWPAAFDKAKLVFSSPPYLQVMKYGKLNWLRLWMLGQEPPSVDAKLFASASLSRYLLFMQGALKSLRPRVKSNGYVCLVIGDVRRGEEQLNLAREVARHSLEGTGFKLLRSISDHLPTEHKVSRIWGSTRGRATKIDRILVLGGARASGLPSAPRINWRKPLLSEERLDGRP